MIEKPNRDISFIQRECETAVAAFSEEIKTWRHTDITERLAAREGFKQGWYEGALFILDKFKGEEK